MVTSFDRPGTAEEHRAAALQRHIDYGTGFDEAAICRTYGLPMPAKPRNFPRVGKLLYADKADERQYLADIQQRTADARQAEADSKTKDADLQVLRMENEIMREQLNRLLLAAGLPPSGATAPVALPPMAIPAVVPAPVPVVGEDGENLPQANWDRQRTIRWIQAHGYSLPPRQGVGMKLIALADFAIEQHRKANPSTEAAG